LEDIINKLQLHSENDKNSTNNTIEKLQKEVSFLKDQLHDSKYQSVGSNIDFNKNFDIEKIYTYMENTWILINGYKTSEVNKRFLTWVNIRNINKKHFNMENVNKK